MKENVYYLYDGEKRVAHSAYFEKVLNKTTKTEDGKIFYNNMLVWAQNT